MKKKSEHTPIVFEDREGKYFSLPNSAGERSLTKEGLRLAFADVIKDSYQLSPTSGQLDIVASIMSDPNLDAEETEGALNKAFAQFPDLGKKIGVYLGRALEEIKGAN